MSALLKLASFTCLILLAGCAAPSGNLPNLRAVDTTRNIWRAGQPTPAGFATLYSLGVTNSVKLNGKPADRLLQTNWLPISTWSQIWPWGVSPADIERAVSAVKPGTVIHCTHGQDRTGLIVACYRVERDGWSCDRAEQEMLANGFHRSLFGLWRAWVVFKYHHPNP